MDAHRATAVAEGVVTALLGAEAAQPPARVHRGTAQQPRHLFGLHLVQQAGRLSPGAEQAGVQEVRGKAAEVRDEPSPCGTGRRRPASRTVLDPEVFLERTAEPARPLAPSSGSRATALGQQVGAEHRRTVSMCLGLTAPGSSGAPFPQTAVVVRGSAQPEQTAFGHGQQLLQILLRQPPPSRLREHHGEGQRRLHTRAAGREVRARVPERAREPALVGPRARQLGTGEGAQRRRSERVPSGNVMRAAHSASAGASPQRQGTPAARYTSAGLRGSRVNRARRSSRLLRNSSRTRGSSPSAAASENEPAPVFGSGRAPRSARIRNSMVREAPGSSLDLPAQQTAEAIASSGGGSAVTTAWAPAADQRMPEAWTLAGSSGPERPAATAPRSARSVPSPISTRSRTARHAELRRTIRSVPPACRSRSTAISGSGPAPAGGRTTPTNRARDAETSRPCTATGSRPATRKWQRESIRRPDR